MGSKKDAFEHVYKKIRYQKKAVNKDALSRMKVTVDYYSTYKQVRAMPVSTHMYSLRVTLCAPDKHNIDLISK